MEQVQAIADTSGYVAKTIEIWNTPMKKLKQLENKMIYRGVEMQVTLSEDGDYLDEVVVNGIHIGHLISEFGCDEILEQHLKQLEI